MTETEWLACEDPLPLIGHFMQEVSFWRFLLRDLTTKRLTERKLRLFACACVRQIWHLLPNEDARLGIDIAERYADLPVSQHKVDLQQAGCWYSLRFERQGPGRAAAALAGMLATASNLGVDIGKLLSNCRCAASYAVSDDAHSVAFREAYSHAGRQQARLLRDILGNPFRMPYVDPSWLHGQEKIVPKLALAVYEARPLPSPVLDPGRLLEIADALERVGCNDEIVLNHLRQPAEHVRGCWVIDAILSLP